MKTRLKIKRRLKDKKPLILRNIFNFKINLYYFIFLFLTKRKQCAAFYRQTISLNKSCLIKASDVENMIGFFSIFISIRNF